MSQPEHRNSVKLSIYISPELMEKLVEHQHTKGMKTLTEASIERIEKGFLNDLESLTYQKLKCRSEIPAHYGKFVRCLEEKRIVTEEQCQACQLYQVIKIPLMTMEKYIETNKELKQEQEQVANEVRKLDAHTKGALLRIIQHNEKTIKEKDALLRKETETRAQLETENNFLRHSHAKMRELYEATMKPTVPVQSNLYSGVGSSMEPTEEVRTMPQTVEPNPQVVKRIIEEKKTTTEEFMPSQEPKKISEPILCPKLSPPNFVSVDDACKNCKSIADCPQYGEFFMLKRVIKNNEARL